MKTNWLGATFKCCGKPVLFLSLVYGGLGGLFLTGSLFLDQRMAFVGAVLGATGIGILLIFALVAFIIVRPAQPAPVAGVPKMNPPGLI